MNYRYMGRTGLKVSELCLGAMTFGRETGEADSRRMMDTFADQGGNFIDTANVYGQGTSEEIVGRWLGGKRRDDFVVATKARFGMGAGPNDVGLSRKHLLASVEASLRRLGTDYIDLFQIHAWDSGTPLDETLGTLNTLVQSGKVRYLGASNVAGWQLQKAADLCGQRGWEPFTCLQPLYNLLDRSIEYEIVTVCLNEGIGMIPWSPLRGGWLSGKYRRGMAGPPADTRIQTAEANNWSERWSVYDNPHTWAVIDALCAVAEQAQKSPAQVALNWLLSQPAVTAPIIGARTQTQLEDNLGATGWALTAEQLETLNAASRQPPPYPYDLLERNHPARAH